VKIVGYNDTYPTIFLEVGMDEEQQESIGNDIHKIIQYAMNPEAAFRRKSAVNMVKEFHKRYGDAVLVDILVGVDRIEKLSSAVVLERSEIDNYVFAKYGVFDEDMFIKLQLTDSWEEFMNQLVHDSGRAAVDAVSEVMINEGIAGEDSLPE
jgi:hypothetical protein